MFEVESNNTTNEADATQTPPQLAPTVESELTHPSLPGDSISTSVVAASLTSDLQHLNSLIRNGLIPPS